MIASSWPRPAFLSLTWPDSTLHDSVARHTVTESRVWPRETTASLGGLLLTHSKWCMYAHNIYNITVHFAISYKISEVGIHKAELMYSIY